MKQWLKNLLILNRNSVRSSLIFNMANVLTVFRLLFSPIVLPFLLVYLLPFNIWWINLFLAILFVAISLTDFFDGAVARAYNHVTWFGEILDPIADKALFYSVLISLVAIHKLYFYWAIILIGREFFVTTLRHIACQKGHELNVIFLAKVKTMIMMASLTVIILTPYHHHSFIQQPLWISVEWGLLCLSIFLSVYTAYQYHRVFIRHIVLNQ